MSEYTPKNKALENAKETYLKNNGFEEIEVDDIDNNMGHIAFMKVNNEFCTGGYYIKSDNNNIFWKIGETEYKTPFSDIKRLFTRSPLRLLNRKRGETNFPVKLGGITIFHAKDNFDKTRFKETKRYKRLREWYQKNKIANNL